LTKLITENNLLSVIRLTGREDPMARTAAPGTDPADILTPYTVSTTATRAARMCWINRHPLEPGTAAFLDGEGLAVCAECAAHCTVCTDDDCEHPRYAYAARGLEG
jgi:hypothetical protein